MKQIAIICLLISVVSTLCISQDNLEDKDIGYAIENQYRFDHAVNINNIDVTVVEGIAELTGTVNNLNAKERAMKIAEMVKGVRSVSNRIEVVPSVNLSDAGIENRVKSAFLTDPATDSYEVNVEVSDKVVTLTGNVDSYMEKELCANVAKSIKGVVGLNNLIDVNYKTDRSDWEIKNEIEQALKWNIMVDDGLVEVSVDDGQVTLSGTVGSAAEKRYAYKTSWVAGVNAVNNEDIEVKWWAKEDKLRKNEYKAVEDDAIEEAIIDAAHYDPRLYSFKISPEANNGWVTLRGNVDNLKAKMAAAKIAENTTGVSGVTNNIKVDSGISPVDSEIRSDIVSRLQNNSVTESREIDVDVNHNIVTLTGTVDSYLEKKEAEWVASGVEGVTAVNNRLKTLNPYNYYWWGYYPYYDLFISPAEIPYPYDEDKLIKQNIATELEWSPYVDRQDVTIDVDDGSVTLTGNVDSWYEYRMASQNAWEGGAFDVTNNLNVE